MIKVLIADDEPAALRSLRCLVPWETLGFRIEGEAANGEEALAIFRERSIDLIVTDIWMPRMDGLELIAALRERSDVPVILLSGYGEFEYARRALQLGVSDYLLKPIDPEELEAKLRAAREHLEAHTAQQKRWHRGLPLMREQLVRRWARGLLGDLSALEEFELIPVAGRDAMRFAVLMVELPRHADDGRKEHLTRFAVRNVLEESCGGRGLLFEESPTRFGIVYLSSGSAAAAEDMQGKGESLVANVQAYAKLSIAISVGPEVELADVPGSYETALMLLDRRNVLSQGETVLTADGMLKGNDSRYMLVEEVKQIVRERYADNLELKGIAAELFTNPVQLGQLFRASTGHSFKEYLLHTRLDAAKDLLTYTDKRVYEIAGEVGFKELDWFYKKFKEYTGRSANGYRDER